MALVKCPECAQEISDQAQACPHCGNPLRPQVIEKTGKNWKLAKLISWLAFIGGGYLFAHGYGTDKWNDPTTGLGFILAFVGLIAILVTKFGTWWNHE